MCWLEAARRNVSDIGSINIIAQDALEDGEVLSELTLYLRRIHFFGSSIRVSREVATLPKMGVSLEKFTKKNFIAIYAAILCSPNLRPYSSMHFRIVPCKR